MKKDLKIIQLACFKGNIGDNANIVGTRRMLNANLTANITFTDLEYLEYEPDPRWGGKKFDDDFVSLVNQHDVLLIGGGGFFEVAVDNSCTGTPLNISREMLDKIKVPIIYYALGFHVTYGITEERLAKFKSHLDYLLESNKILVSLRNDGSWERLREICGEEYARRIDKCPDGGFFTTPKQQFHIEIPAERRIIGIQLGGDAIPLRFVDEIIAVPKLNIFQRIKNLFLGEHNIGADREGKYEEFLIRLSDAIKRLFDEGKRHHVVLIPHIPEDFGIINDFIKHVGPPYARQNITVAPYVFGREAQDYIVDLYSKCELVIGMRFHANVCCIGLNVATIGLGSFDKIEGVYEELGISDRMVCVDDENFEKNLYYLIHDSLHNKTLIKRRYEKVNDNLLREINFFHAKIEDFINGFYK